MENNRRKSPLPESQARLVICCVTFLATQATVAGVWLHAHGSAGGAGFALIVLSNAIAGLIGFLGGRVSGTATTPPPQLQLPTDPTKP